jgi:hypothetical protein
MTILVSSRKVETFTLYLGYAFAPAGVYRARAMLCRQAERSVARYVNTYTHNDAICFDDYRIEMAFVLIMV